ncbi:MAG: MFS transporter [Acidobacteriaceae bacterium]|nr:MFS transporter [Acidobacteriaceae bacterium]
MMSTIVEVTTGRLTPNQIRGFWAAWAGWALDGMDSFIYALVLVPSLRELLPASGITPSSGNIGFYGGLLFAIFLIGWGLSFLWGPLADRFGRVRTLMLTILCYSAFTLAGALSTNLWELGAFRLLAGIGIGGEWTLGGVFVAEEWPEERRVWGGSLMHTGYYFGTTLASLANYWIGSHFGWRAMFLLGGTPALLVAFIRYGVSEPARWTNLSRPMGQPATARAAFSELFSDEYRRRTLLNALYVLVSMVGLWAGSVYVPSAVTQLATRAGQSLPMAARLASTASVLLSIGTMVGCLLVPMLARFVGRRVTLGFFYLLTAAFIFFSFGYAFYLPQHAVSWFLGCLFFLGVGGASFCVFTVWLPEQYRTECRASAFAFATSFGRFIAAGATFAVGAAVSHAGTLGYPVAMTGFAFLLGLALLPLGVETRGTPLLE